ncbi:MAG: segregation and condensation protein A, partial [Planctomycetota bacterium]
MQTEYKIDLDTYNGPLDLLLYLIRREEVDIYDIPIAKITDQYMAYLNELQSIDIGLAGDFLVMASTLMYVKSQTLLPRSEVTDEEDGEDP